MQELVLFIITYIITFLIYKLIITRKKVNTKKEKKITEVEFLVSRYKLDLKKVNYNKLLNTICLVSALDISITVTVIAIIRYLILRVVVGIIIMILSIIISYTIVGKYYVKKGMTKNV